MRQIAIEKRRVLWAAVVLAAVAAAVCAVTLRSARAAGTPQLPNLVADPPDSTSLATDSSTGTTRLLLRFNGYIHNLGPGAVDFRGNRAKPAVSKATEEEVARAKEKQESLPQKTEEELAVPPMKVTQREFTTAVGEEETNIERAHVEEPSAGELIYVSADGHHHWHLQKAARYSLWNAAKTAEVAPAQKVGFCLDDSQHVETSVGPSTAVYADNVAPFRDFCQQYNPLATSLFEGISPGWRDVYNKELAFQWVDASNVLPGEYWLREDVNPLGYVKETGGANAPSYSTSPTIIPGFDALAQSASATAGETATLTLTSRAFKDTQTPRYTIVTAPAHGKLGAVSGNHVTYTPEAGYTGPDSFTFSAADPTSQFPTSPAVATVSVEVVPPGATKTLLAGDASTGYSVSDVTTAGREESFQFTAKSSGTVEEMQFRTNSASNATITGVALGVFAENGGKPGTVLGQGKVSGTPAPSTWLKATGLSVPVTAGTKYWLVALPLGSGQLHYNAAVSSGGTGNLETSAGGFTSLTAQSSWVTYNQGPVGFQALGTTSAPVPSVTIEGAPASMNVGATAQLAANVKNDSPTVTWSASAGSITSGGFYTAPAEPPAGGRAVITATTSKGAKAEASIEIVKPVPSVTIEGAPASMNVGATAQLAANVKNDSPTVTWSASAGSITSGGFYTAPAEPPAGGQAVITATTSKGAKAEASIEIVKPAASGLLAGDATATYAVTDQTTAGREEAFQFTAKSSGTVEEMQFRTNTVANTGVTSVKLGLFAENAGRPGAVLGSGTVAGTPPTSTWLRATGLSVAVTAGTKYWLVALPVGSGQLHYNAAVSSGGTGNVETTTGGMSAMTAQTSWETYNQGPVGFQALGTSAPSASAIRASAARVASVRRPARRAARTGHPNVMIEGAPATITAGTGLQLHAVLASGAGRVRWRASAGAISAGGVYRAPAMRPRGGSVVISATAPGGRRDVRRIAIAPAAPATAAPTLYLPEAPAGAAGRAAALPAPQAMLVGGQIVIAVRPGRAGRLTVAVTLHGRSLGACATLTPAGRSFTCRVPLGVTPSAAPVSVTAALASHGRILHSARATSSVAPMTMIGRWLGSASGAALQFICGPSAAAAR